MVLGQGVKFPGWRKAKAWQGPEEGAACKPPGSAGRAFFEKADTWEHRVLPEQTRLDFDFIFSLELMHKAKGREEAPGS